MSGDALQAERLVLLLTDQRAFGHGAAACAAPDHAFVFFDKADAAVGYVSVSIACSALFSRPTLAGIPRQGDAFVLTTSAMGFVGGVCRKLQLSACDGKPGGH